MHCGVITVYFLVSRFFDEIMRLFLSYAHDDEDRVRELVEAIAPFHRLWIDKQSIAPGRDWREEIKRGIRHCEAFLFVASTSSCCSAECHWEIDFAKKHRKKIIPLILEDCQLRPDLAQLQWIFLEEIDDGVRSLLKELQPSPPYFWMALSLAELAVIVGMTLWN